LDNFPHTGAFEHLYVAVPQKWSSEKVAGLSPSARKVMENKRYQLLVIDGFRRDQQSVSDTKGVRSNDI
jgi:hypothetical protein